MTVTTRKVNALTNVGTIQDGDVLVGERVDGTTVRITYQGGSGSYTNEDAQDAVGAMIDSSLTYVDSTPLLQRAALTGDVTASAGSNATTIANGAVTLAKQADMATASVVYRKTAGTGVPEVNTLATLKTDLGLTGTNSGDQTITLTGDVTGSGTGSFATTLTNAPVIAKVLTGFTAGAGTVTSTDSILGAFQKLDGNDRTVSVVNAVAHSTGIITGGLLSIGSPATTFSITSGTGMVVDNTVTPATVTQVSWSTQTNVTATYVAAGLVSYVAIDSSGNVVQQLAEFTNAQHRQYIVIGSLIHVNLTNIDAINQLGEIAISPMSQLSDLTESIGIFNVSGNVFSANGANLNLNKSAGSLHAQGSNWANNTSDPNVVSLASLTALTFQYRFQTGTNGDTGTSINPDIYDLAGVSTAVSNNKFTIQRIYSFVSNNVKIQPGQFVYNSLAEAKASLQNEVFVTESSIASNGVLRGFLIVKKGTTSLTSSTDAFFYEAGKFSGSIGIGGQSVSSMQNTYDNSVDPEVLTDSTRGAISIKRGSAADTDNIIEGLNGAGSTTFTLKGNGALAASGAVTGSNLSGTNTGDQTTIVGITGTKAEFDTAVSDGNILYVGDITQYTDELAQDAVGSMVDTSLNYVDGTPLLQRAALTGDVTASAGSNATTIANGAVTLAKQADMATASVVYRKTAGTGAPEVNTLATLKTDLGLTGTNSGDQTTIVGITGTKAEFDTAVSDGNILYVGDVTQYTDELAQDAVGGMVDSTLVYTDGTPLLSRAALTGDVTASAGSNSTTIANDAVTYAKMQNVSATDKLLGRSTSGAGDVEEIACTAAGRNLLDDADASAQRTTLGLVIGTDVQAYDAELAALAGLTSAADKIPYFSGSGTAALADFSSALRTFLTTPSSANLRALLSDESGTGAALFAGGAIGAATATSINFGQDSLNYYDEFTFTPALTLQTPGDLVVTSASGSGSGVRIGNVVIANLTVSGIMTFTTGSGFIRITGLPFTASVPSAAATLGQCGNNVNVAYGAGFTNLQSAAVNSQTYLQLYANGSSQVQTAITAAIAIVSGNFITFRASLAYNV